MRFALLLDSGALIYASTEAKAREYLRNWRLNRRDCLARPGVIVAPRPVVAFVRIKMKNKAKGGHARAAKLSPERRSEIARKAAKTRWRR